MPGERPKGGPALLLEYALVWDESDQDWVVAHRTDYRRQKTVEFLHEVLFNDTAQTHTSEPFQCIGYRDLLLLINLDVTGAPTDIYIDLQFSDDGATWYKYMRGPFIDLRYEDGAGDLKECLDAPVLAKFMRIYVVSSGCEAAKTFKLSVKAILNG